jgi:hypothetical protein
MAKRAIKFFYVLDASAGSPQDCVMEKDIGRGLIGHGSETPKANQSFSCSSDLGTLQRGGGAGWRGPRLSALTVPQGSELYLDRLLSQLVIASSHSVT